MSNPISAAVASKIAEGGVSRGRRALAVFMQEEVIRTEEAKHKTMTDRNFTTESAAAH